MLRIVLVSLCSLAILVNSIWALLALWYQLPWSLAGVGESIHLAVQNRAALLHTTIVASTNDTTVMYDHRTNGDSTFRKACAGFVDSRLHEDIHAFLL